MPGRPAHPRRRATAPLGALAAGWLLGLAPALADPDLDRRGARLLPPLRLAEPGSAPTLPPAPLPGRLRLRDVGGLPARIEDPRRALAPFHRRLAAVARGDLRARARIAVYSDSVNGADWVTASLRRRLQARFGDAGKGFVPIAPGWRSQAHRGVRWSSRGWDVDVVNRAGRRDRRYGLGGIVATGRGRGARTHLVLDRPHHEVSLLAQRFPGAGRVALGVRGAAQPRRGAEVVASLDGPAEDARVRLAPRGAFDRVTVQGRGGRVRLYGVVAERAGPGVVVDGLMLIGAFARTLLHLDPAHWAAQVRLRAPDLLVFWMGGNDAVADGMRFSSARFVPDYARAIGHARAGRPDAGCLVVSVLDAGERSGGWPRTIERLPRVVEAQREVARRAGCAFFDLFEAMGGPNTVVEWARADPPLVSGDLKHLTTAGARAVAALLERALLQAYDRWLARGGPAGPGATAARDDAPVAARPSRGPGASF